MSARPQSVRCRWCGQHAGRPCLTIDGRRAHYSHAVRKRDAADPDAVSLGEPSPVPPAVDDPAPGGPILTRGGDAA